MTKTLRDCLGTALVLLFVGSLWVQQDDATSYTGKFTIAVLIFTALISLITLISPIRAVLHRRPKAEEDRVNGALLRKVGLLMVLLIAWIWLYEPLGFIPSSILFFTAISVYLTEHKLKPVEFGKIILSAAIMIAAIYVVFDVLLLVPLPKGFL